MKALLGFLLLVISPGVYAQLDTNRLLETIQKLDKALLSKDSLGLSKILDDKVSYGHSNGWVESKSDIFKDLRTGYLIYSRIESSEIKVSGDKDWANVRMNANVKGSVNKNDFELKLHILQVWKRSKGEWKLVARQSTKI